MLNVTKEVQVSIKMQSQLRDEFMAVASGCHHPPTQSEVPNTLTAQTITQSRKGENVSTAISTSKLFKQLGI